MDELIIRTQWTITTQPQKKKETLPHVRTWMNLGDTTLGEGSRSSKVRYHRILAQWSKPEKQSNSCCQGWGKAWGAEGQ